MDLDKKRIAKNMLFVRLAQMMVNEEYKAAKFKVPIHLAMGHEAIAVAISEVMGEEDELLLTHRNIAYNLARAGKLAPIMDEYLLKPSGLSGGKFGSMNMINPEEGVIYSSSILANQFPVATGVAMGDKVIGRKGVTIVLGGDGSMEEGAFYESMLMAKSMSLPVIFLIENNEWSMSTHITERRCPVDLSKFSDSMGINYKLLEGNDVYSYIETLGELRKSMIADNAPACVEVKISTLGDWIGPESPEHPKGKFINYHSGPAPTVSFNEWPVIKDNEEDPIFVLTNHFDESSLKLDVKGELAAIQKEIS